MNDRTRPKPHIYYRNGSWCICYSGIGTVRAFADMRGYDCAPTARAACTYVDMIAPRA